MALSMCAPVGRIDVLLPRYSTTACGVQAPSAVLVKRPKHRQHLVHGGPSHAPEGKWLLTAPGALCRVGARRSSSDALICRSRHPSLPGLHQPGRRIHLTPLVARRQYQPIFRLPIVDSLCSSKRKLSALLISDHLVRGSMPAILASAALPHRSEMPTSSSGVARFRRLAGER
jgi:hypothetical protein